MTSLSAIPMSRKVGETLRQARGRLWGIPRTLRGNLFIPYHLHSP